MSNHKSWCVAKGVTPTSNADTFQGTYPITPSFTVIKKFKTRDAARAFRKTYTGKAKVQIVNTVTNTVSR